MRGRLRRWALPSRFATDFGLSAVLCVLGLYGFIAILDPYGLRAGPGVSPVPLTDLNGRLMYPQIIRGGRFDAAVFGTSTVRLLDPGRLGGIFGARFANLGLNAGTPWEQVQLADLFLKRVSAPSTLVWGLDRTWCDPGADRPEKRETFRTFPHWLFDDDPWNDWAETLSLRALELAGRVVLTRAGFVPPRIRGDGWENFLPPEEAYDPARAAATIHRNDGPDPIVGPATGPFPALQWLRDYLRRLPAQTSVLFVLPPIHVAAQPSPGSAAAALDSGCKTAIAGLATRPKTRVIDFRRATALTRDDTRYWDRLHYRLPVAGTVIDALAAVQAGGGDDPGGLYGVSGSR